MSAAAATATGRILVVDDDPDIRLALSARLKASGFQVSTAEDGVAALRAASAIGPDLVLLDIRMPGEDGFAVLARLKRSAELRHIPVVMLSAQDPELAEPQALAGGAHGYCRKPFSKEELLDAIGRALAR